VPEPGKQVNPVKDLVILFENKYKKIEDASERVKK
jgi:hypothetical protein